MNRPLRPTRKEIAFYYQTNRSRFYAPERVHIGHIVRNVLPEQDRGSAHAVLETARHELDRGVPFNEVAARYSDCGSEGEIAWFPRGVMVEEFDEVVFNLQPGETSPVFETRFGVHIARLLGKRSEGIPPLNEIYDEVREHLYAERLRRLADANR